MTSTSARSKPATRLEISVQYATSHAGLPGRAQVRRWVRAVERGPAEIAVRFVGQEEGQALNARYRGGDRATNVLSFAYQAAPRLAGDLVLCVPVVLREAARQGKSGEAHFAHLIVHGMLHLRGHEHDNEEDAVRMEAAERRILKHLGFPDPYGTDL
jgi:probable rRNA maturation factor